MYIYTTHVHISVPKWGRTGPKSHGNNGKVIPHSRASYLVAYVISVLSDCVSETVSVYVCVYM